MARTATTQRTAKSKASRRYVRYPITAPVILHLDGYDFHAQTTTLAEGGAFVLCEDTAKANSRINAVLQLDDLEIPVTCRVVYNGKEGMGLEFVEIPPGYEHQLRRYFLLKKSDGETEH